MKAGKKTLCLKLSIHLKENRNQEVPTIRNPLPGLRQEKAGKARTDI